MMTTCNECGVEIPDDIDKDVNGQQCAECKRVSAKFQAMGQILALARAHGLAVSVVTPEDVLLLKGVEEPIKDQRDLVIGSWEFRHYGDNWADWFEGMDAGDIQG